MTARTTKTATTTTTWPLCEIPEIPPERGFESSATTELRARYEDITQDGRVQLASLMPGLAGVWRAMYRAEQMASFQAQGILPILRRLVIRGEKGPFSVNVPIEAKGTWRLAREKGGDRLFLNMWLEARAATASTFAPSPPKDSPKALVGRIYAEHVITKPFASTPSERKVTRLVAPGIPEVPEDEHPFEDAQDLLRGGNGSGASELENAREYVFGMMHTDSNQHVNSLVYPRLFEEELIQRGVIPSNLLSRAMEIRWRKPFFAGDRATMSIVSGALQEEGGRPAVGAFAPPNTSATTKPSCTVAMWFQ